ncbi:MAG: thioredoxin [Patescibacteria group bacterium]
MHFTEQNFQQEVENNTGLVLVDFFTTWCGPCKLMGLVINEIIENYKDKDIKIGKLDIDECGAIGEKYNIMSVPTIVLFKSGKIVEQINGYCDKEYLVKVINKYLVK